MSWARGSCLAWSSSVLPFIFKNKRIFRTRLSQTGAKITLFSYFASVSNSAPHMNSARDAYRALALTMLSSDLRFEAKLTTIQIYAEPVDNLCQAISIVRACRVSSMWLVFHLFEGARGGRRRGGTGGREAMEGMAGEGRRGAATPGHVRATSPYKAVRSQRKACVKF